jgi:hypothetical protein
MEIASQSEESLEVQFGSTPLHFEDEGLGSDITDSEGFDDVLKD